MTEHVEFHVLATGGSGAVEAAKAIAAKHGQTVRTVVRIVPEKMPPVGLCRWTVTLAIAVPA